MKELISQMSTLEIGIIVTITGIIIVFAMLILLVSVLQLFGYVSASIQKAHAKRADAIRTAAMAAMSEDGNYFDDKTVAAVVEDNDGLSEEVVAVISAAVSSLYVNSGRKPVIKAIKKSSSRRTAWSNAGIADNTRAF